MTCRLLKFFPAALLFLSIAASAAEERSPQETVIWAESPVGKCYPSIQKYLSITYGNNYKDDENIKVFNAFSQNGYQWVSDVTSEINTTRVMFKVRRDGRACAILFAPYATSIYEVRGEKDLTLPSKYVANTTPSPGFPEIEIIYKLEEENTYSPQYCFKIFPSKIRKMVSCLYIFN